MNKTNRNLTIDGVCQTIKNDIDYYNNLNSIKNDIGFKRNGDNIFLLTTRFNQISETKTENLIKYVSSKSENVYSHLLNKLVKQHHRAGRKQYHPTMWSFIDFAGSKTHQMRIHETPHIHSILILHPSTVDAFNSLCEVDFKIALKSNNTKSIQEIHSQRIMQGDENLKKVIDYSGKVYLKNYIPGVSEEVKSTMFFGNGPSKI